MLFRSPGTDTRDGADVIKSRIVTEGSQVLLGGNDCYIAMCHKCWKDRIRREAEEA